MKTKEMKFNVIELLGNAHTTLVNAYNNDLIDFDNFNQISNLILESQKKYRHSFDYDRLNTIITNKNRKEVKNEEN